MDKHIVTSYDNDLEYIKILIIEMGVLLEKQTFEAIELIKLHNLKIMPNIKETEKKINSAEKKIREYSTNTLTKRQPSEINHYTYTI